MAITTFSEEASTLTFEDCSEASYIPLILSVG